MGFDPDSAHIVQLQLMGDDGAPNGGARGGGEGGEEVDRGPRKQEEGSLDWGTNAGESG
jgi:hypothetical protein